jgi:hypothetical protein
VAGRHIDPRWPAFEVSMTSDWHQIEADVRAALEFAEEATLKTNDLVGRTLETAVSGKEAATTLHHAYSAQVLVARVQDWVAGWARPQEQATADTAAAKLDECLSWMRRAQSHGEKLSRCFPASEKGAGAAGIAEWAERWPQDYFLAKGNAEKSLEAIQTAIETIVRHRSSMTPV